nr:hypothetical protein [Sphingomonas melonis]
MAHTIEELHEHAIASGINKFDHEAFDEFVLGFELAGGKILQEDRASD